uniref:(California timema) hypothetical protein n=1 Tax=Timema californicum TaxID=61474 RepID=A0A7R9P9T5_TIMCA|nr:unnamed protein product [Timema californicum]
MRATFGESLAIQEMVPHPAKIGPEQTGCTALQRSAADGHLEVVKQLLKHRADVNRQDNVHGNTALHEASWKGYSRTVECLCKAKANLHLKNCGGFAALHLCCQNGHNQSCRELLLAGCNPNLQNNYGDTPLHTSARYGHAGVTRILISAKCHVSDQNKNGDTALHIAAAMGRRKLTRILLEAGCDKSLKNKQNETARDIATRKDLNEILIILNSTPGSRNKSKSGKSAPNKEHNEKKRGKNESGTSSKDSSSRQKEKKKQKNEHKVHFQKTSMGKQWSPYGCHYYPDPKAFPQPNLDSLPHEPLKKGEQYYLDLAGNIRKGPVGVGYTCYCAPFFQHMEARLDRDKQELKAHIDQANERLDQRVSSLERQTQGKLSELTRCVVAERALCNQRHMHLAQWLARGGPGRSSERVRAPELEPLPVPRARSLELLLEERGMGDSRQWRDNGQSLEELDEQSWRRRQHQDANPKTGKHTHVQYMNELEGRLREGLNGFSRHFPHNRSVDALVDQGTIPRRGQPHRRSANEFLASERNGDSTNKPEFLGSQKHNRSFDTLLDTNNHLWRNEAHHRSANELPASHHQRLGENLIRPNQSVDVHLNKEGASWRRPAEQSDGKSRHQSPSRQRRSSENFILSSKLGTDEVEEDTIDNWRGQPMRRSVHEMVAQIQGVQVKPEAQSCKMKKPGRESQIHWQKNGGWRREGVQYSHDREADNSSESSEGEEEDRLTAYREPGLMGHHKVPNYENVGVCPWRDEESRLVSGLPYRSRSAVYSPTQDTDQHNDSGYSTKLYGSSKGPSPSLSGNLDCDGMLPPQHVYHNGKLPNYQPPPSRQRHEQGDSSATNILFQHNYRKSHVNTLKWFASQLLQHNYSKSRVNKLKWPASQSFQHNYSKSHVNKLKWFASQLFQHNYSKSRVNKLKWPASQSFQHNYSKSRVNK